ncbi:mRNA capping enzyme, beta chain domain-containing protein [Sarocladium implicatum]|nr:mRNA capping enzyme, beta chain domain-containing protein [Sarocladium implicatum]
MDLRSVLNNSETPAKSAQQPPPPPQSRPSQSPAQYGGYREYPPGPQPHQSPGRAPSAERPSSHPSQAPQQQQPYPPQASPYSTPGPYSRNAPPPLQSVGSYHHDARSPSSSMPAPSPSSFRHHPPTPSAGSAAAPGYPFPPTQGHTETTSPVQRQQQYPPQYQHQRQESYNQSAPSHAPGQYAQQQHPVPQTPPVGTSGSSQFPPHQRSQSTHSTPTPTSAHSQQPYGAPYQGSPVSATQQHPPSGYGRQTSQPPTPGGQPIPHSAAGARPAIGGDLVYKQPSSPYQQRNAPPNAQTHPSPHIPSHPPPQLQRSSTSHSAFESPVAEPQSRPQQLREREQSLSVSPKTRINQLPPGYPDQHPAAYHSQQQQQHQAPAIDHDAKPSYPQNMTVDSDRSVTPAKRKMQDRDMSPQDMERKHARTAQPEINGQKATSRAATVKSESPAAPKKMRLRRPVPPRWAQSVEILKGSLPKHPNYVLQKRRPAHLNGNRSSTSKTRPTSRSRHASPDASRLQQPVQAPAPPEGPQDLLGPWEPCLTGIKPYEEVSKLIADFLFVNVINCRDIREIESRGIQFEIEAKLGTVIDRRTSQRVELGASSECILENAQTFRSSMSEGNHKAFNDMLNDICVQAHAKNKNAARVPVEYKHRREIDRFFEIPSDLQARLPSCMLSRFPNNKRPRVRVTHDQQTKELLGMIVKARVADIDLHMPKSVMDCRLSINLEMTWDGTVEELEAAVSGDRQPDRNKDRLSYSQGPYQVDLTQVTQTGPQGLKKEHELEIELASGLLIDQGRRAMSGAPNRYPELVEGFIDNVRLLARKARDL